MGKRKHKMTLLQARKIIKDAMVKIGLRLYHYEPSEINEAAKELQAAENASKPRKDKGAT